MTSKHKAYDAFWTQLLPAYPISKGELRLPIASELITLEGFDYTDFIENLTTILTTLLNVSATEAGAIARARPAMSTYCR